MPKNPKQHPASTAASRPSRLSLLWPLFCLIGFVIVTSLVVAWIMTADDPSVPAKPQLPAGQPTAGAAPDTAVRAKLVGRWFRLDGDYLLQIRSVRSDGSMDATYLNPRSINVAKAQVTRQGEQTSVYVELNDVGYPGSYYNLVYDAKQDHLTGTYSQKALNQQFQVEFMRMAEE
ncbi:MAG: hypothetical protein ABSH20_10950 [Tepidisphaeraceae bacterium]|jgi:hypothetical protein